MTTFNLYNETTWEVSVNDMALQIRNKAIGTIGQKISLIRELQAKIEKLINQDQGHDTDFAVADRLRLNNFRAYQQMKVEIELPHDEVQRILHLTYEVLNAWKDVENRNSIWKSLIPKLQELEPFFNSSRWDRLAGDRALNKLVAAKVSGNEAWHEYIKIARELVAAQKANSILSNKVQSVIKELGEEELGEDVGEDLTDDDPISHDYDDEDDDE